MPSSSKPGPKRKSSVLVFGICTQEKLQCCQNRAAACTIEEQKRRQQCCLIQGCWLDVVRTQQAAVCSRNIGASSSAVGSSGAAAIAAAPVCLLPCISKDGPSFQRGVRSSLLHNPRKCGEVPSAVNLCTLFLSMDHCCSSALLLLLCCTCCWLHSTGVSAGSRSM